MASAGSGVSSSDGAASSADGGMSSADGGMGAERAAVAAPPAHDGPIVLFDGVCNVCNATVDFILARDRAASFRFAPLQSEPGRALAARHGLDPEAIDRVVLVHRDRAWTRSGAMLRVLRHLPWPWPLLAAGLVVPRPLRDWAYDRFAERRYRLFGRREACRVPSPAERERFLA